MKKLTASFFLFLLLLPAVALAQAGPARAALDPTGSWYYPSLEQFRLKVFTGTDTEIFGERYTFANVSWILSSIQLQLFPDWSNDTVMGIVRNLMGMDNSQTPTLAQLAPLGPASLMAGSIAEMGARPPVSAVGEARRFLARFDPASPALAQSGGYGYSHTQAIRPLWTAARNSAYFIMIILLIVSGFMVIFRVKVNPQTAVTLQLMIPRIVISLLLVTFSYAIAGLVIDAVFVLVAMALSITSASADYIIHPNNLGTALGFFAGPGFWKVFIYYLAVLGAFISVSDINSLGSLFVLIFTILVFVLLFRVWWTLVKNYLMFIFLIIIGPWQIMLGLLPGQNGFGNWFRNLIAHAAVFVAVPLMFFTSIVVFQFDVPGGSSWAQILVDLLSRTITGVESLKFGASGFPNFPLFGGTGGIFKYAASFAVLAMIPKVADMIKEALKVPAFKYGSAFGEAIGIPISTAQTGYGYYDKTLGPTARKAADERAYTIWKRRAEGYPGAGQPPAPPTPPPPSSTNRI